MQKGRVFRVTEEQAKRFKISEDIQIKANVSDAGGDVKRAVDLAKQEAQKAGLSKDKMQIVIDANESEEKDGFHINESQIFTINDLFRKK